ncbi:hypothetical protein C0063_03260 [Pseudoxanthomonas sp. KAs_5_3]|nr:hypothetical protein C0063_03260 [Pseudoxanthomonas sp. KAs_5_3]SFV27758.1 hypothetical protein SAMN05428990_0779 [Pseudoxanthomonas sp. YR558]
MTALPSKLTKEETMTIFRNAALAIAAALALTACGSKQPSEAEAKAALRAEFERLMGSAVQVQDFKDFEVRNCRKAESTDDVVCDLGGAIVLNIAGTPQTRPFIEPVRFSKASGEWTAHKP